jgi:4-amino-4-deoxy-L-arabinose transferase-like glycosyltransferase
MSPIPLTTKAQDPRVWSFLLLSLFVCLPPMLIGAGNTEPDRIMENHTMVSSQETWVRQQSGEKDAWLMPSWNGRPRIEKPPMSVWLNLLAWTGLDSKTAPADTLVLRARLMAAALAALALVATFWAGMSLTGDPRTAALAVLVTGTMSAFVRQARFATYDTHMLGFVTLAVATGFWAMKSSRRMGWILAGLAMGAAVMTKGPLAFALVIGPLAVMIAVDRTNGRRNAGWLLIALALALLVSAPWTYYMLKHVATAQSRLATEYFAPTDFSKPPWYYLGLIGMVLPWSIWFLVSVCRPFTVSGGERRRLLLAWSWFAFLFVFFSIPGAKAQRYISPILPAAGLMIAQLWPTGDRIAKKDRETRLIHWLRISHWAILLIVSLGFSSFIVCQGTLLKHGLIRRQELPGFNALSGLLFGVLLTALTVRGAWWHFRGKPYWAAVTTAVWAAILFTTGNYCYSQSYHSKYPQRPDAERVAAATAGRDLVYLCLDEKIDREPTKIFLFYIRRIVLPVTEEQLAGLVESGKPIDVIIRAGFGRDKIMERMGLQKLFDYADDQDKPRCLYRIVTRQQ